MDEKLLNKIRALFAKGNDPATTPQEAEAFNAKAFELMRKHDLDMSDLPDGDTKTAMFNVEMDSHVADRTEREYDAAVGSILQECFNVKIVTSRKYVEGVKKPRYVVKIIGTSDDRQLALEVLPILQTIMFSGLNRYKKENGITKYNAVLFRSYYWGVSNGYIKASLEGRERALAQASAEQKESYGLMVQKKEDAIAEWTAEAFPNLTKGRSIKLNSSSDAFKTGYKDGSSMKLIQPKKIN